MLCYGMLWYADASLAGARKKKCIIHIIEPGELNLNSSFNTECNADVSTECGADEILWSGTKSDLVVWTISAGSNRSIRMQGEMGQ
ncbi:hypothetical protein EYC84_010093 [Monilinia fructicola]|uniref:Uncharacterized protein n=1 Tax=Monilinia fructicola TaxID=38448 RepID=A0A5M9JGZ5_MONFR|nr:hypothetical protein EYC84_010093 [Monilinia fructicola]